MSLVITVGKNANFKVAASGTATASVLGVQNLDLGVDWETKKIMHLQDSAKTTVMLLKNWTVSGTLTEDMGDTGQDIIRTAYNAGSNIAILVQPTSTTISTACWLCETGLCTKYSTKVDPMAENTASFTIESVGMAITPPS
jgi:hypothetical protein